MRVTRCGPLGTHSYVSIPRTPQRRIWAKVIFTGRTGIAHDSAGRLAGQNYQSPGARNGGGVLRIVGVKNYIPCRACHTNPTMAITSMQITVRRPMRFMAPPWPGAPPR
jgi:hypothetical protein